jgi:succinyl-diaminopimelate desuccinylase
VSNLNSGTGADNVIPGELDAQFNFRYSTAVTRAALQQRLEAVLVGHGLDFDIEWRTSGDPFLTEGGALLHAVRCSIRDVVAIEPQLATDGGTSDGRFIAPAGAEVVELGPVNSTIHKIDECLKVDELDQLSRIYERILMRLLGNGVHS